MAQCSSLPLNTALIQGIIMESKSGRRVILADRVIDCTGDADVAHFAGAEYRHGVDRYVHKICPRSLVHFLGIQYPSPKNLLTILDFVGQFENLDGQIYIHFKAK